ncbi:hypothetical protein CDAR_217391 [Caerostris darwini]|uniref:Uncharacterized protein n=1 Tax=Caerostris darwini TaxID=1538125 RepID=A0AAV4SJJ6_9ARAC|nr:hypothetical protein CDAR_217391 [Caerostris darwini]
MGTLHLQKKKKRRRKDTSFCPEYVSPNPMWGPREEIQDSRTMRDNFAYSTRGAGSSGACNCKQGRRYYSCRRGDADGPLRHVPGSDEVAPA